MARRRTTRPLAAALAFLCLATPALAGTGRIKALFLGDDGHHKPAQRAGELLPPLAKAGIDVAYTDDLADLNSENLGRYDALIIYANHTEIAPDQERALLDFVEGGKGLVVLHCGSYCFLNSPKYIALVGGQFQRHGGEEFQAAVDRPEHPALEGFEPFKAWDETYVHTKLSDDRLVLMHRDDEGGRKEPWTWVRTQGKGRVFYTASGHDERVFTNPSYHTLVVGGIRWATGKGADFALKPLEYADAGAAIPNYVKSNKWGAQGEPFRKMQKPLPADESQQHLSVPGGFRVERFAADPDIAKPICLSWDERGRLWIASTVDYPNEKQPEGKGRDKIVICEDTDGDGKADKFKTFADELSIPTSMVHVPGGLVVAQAPDVLFLADTDGDDAADVRKVLFTGFHTDDTHAGPSNLRLGFDGWIYATVGYAGFEGEVGGKRFRFGQNLFRFKPDGSDMEVLTSTSNNTWGLGITETNEVVYSTANGEHSSYLGLPNRYFESVRGWIGKGNDRMADHDRIRPVSATRQVDWFGGFTAAAGHAVYTARQFPESFWDRAAFVCEPTGHVVHLCQMSRDGSHLASHDRFNLLASTDEWTSPVVAEVGPDGAVWVADWYNYIVQHNPTPLGFETGKGNAYETPLRDKTHGRIYRVVNAGAPLGKSFDLSKAGPDELVAALKSDNMLWRMKAQWALVARGKADVAPALAAVASDPGVDATGENPAAIHALWALRGLGALDRPDEAGRTLLASSLRHKAPGVRRAAADVFPRSDDDAAAALLPLLDDPDPVVRRSALLALGEGTSSDEAGAKVHAMLTRRENASDRWIPLAATAAAARSDRGFLAASLGSKENNEAVRRVVRVVAEHFARGDKTDGLPTLLDRLADADPADSEAFLAGLAAGWPSDRTLALDEAAQAKLVDAMGRLNSAGQLHLATLAGRWGLGEKFAGAMKELREKLAGEISDAGRPEKDRIEAARRLASMSPEGEDLDGLLAEVNARATPTLASGLLDALSQSASPEVGTRVVGRWGQLTPALRRQAFDVLQRRPEWTRALLDGIEAGEISATDLAIDQAQRLTAYPDKALADRARGLLDRGDRMPSPDRQKVLAELLPLTEKNGDAAGGKLVFEKNCAKCHRVGNLGEEIGPNLTGFNVHPKEKILTEVIDPNRSVEGNFRQYTVATSDGQVYSGLLASETRTAIELVDSEAKRHKVLRDEIDEMIASPKSLMPEGFEKQLTPAEITDLLEFLTAKGKYVPLPLDKAATVVSTRGMFYDQNSPAERLVFPDWSPKEVDGIPFVLVDPRGGRTPNAVLLFSPNGSIPPTMPKSVSVPCNTRAKAVHVLGGVGGWAYPYGREGTVSMIVRLRYRDGQVEDHPLRNGVELADYIRRVDVPGSKFAFMLRGQQLRYLSIQPKRDEPIAEIELVKGEDETAPVVMAVTVETP